MSDRFDENQHEETAAPARPQSRSRALLITGLVLVLAFFALTTFSSIYTDRLWYRAEGYGEVFSKLFWTRTGLFVVFGLLMAVAVGANMYLAHRFRPFFRPDSPEQAGLERYRDAVLPVRGWLLAGVSTVIGLFAGTAAAGEWRTYLLWANRTDFDRSDRFFGQDIGFYVFELPWLHYLVNFAMAALVIALLAAATVHYLYGGIRLQTPGDRLTGAAQVQFSVLLGLFVLAKAADYWLDRYDLVSASGNLIDGITYTDDHAVLPAKNILLGISVICAILFFLNIWRRTWTLPSVGLALLVLSAVLLGMIWPGIVQAFQVRPTEQDKERPYIANNIASTREGYDIQDVDLTEYTGTGVGSDDQATVLADTASVPLVDPQLVHQAFEQIQQVRSYYSVSDVLDVDRYDIEGTDRALVLGVRELDQRGLPDDARNWSNLHTVYTHGNGIIAAFANQRPADDGTEGTEIQWAEGQQANQNALSEATGGYESRVYYGEQSPDYSIVGKVEGAGDVELNLGGESDSSESTTYDGDGGVDGRQHVAQAAVRREVRRPQLPAVRAGQREQQGALHPQPARARAEGRAVADGRLRRLPGGGRRPDPVGRRRLHDDRPLPAGGEGVDPDDDGRLAHPGQQPADRADRPDQLHAQRGQGDRRRLRRHRAALRLGHRGPDAARVARGLPRHRPRPRGDARGAGQPPALPRGPVQGAALPVRPLPRHRPGHLLPEGRLVGGAERSRAGRQAPAAVPPVRAGPRDRRRQVLADLGLRAVQQEQPGGVRVRRLRRRPTRRPTAGSRCSSCPTRTRRARATSPTRCSPTPTSPRRCCR